MREKVTNFGYKVWVLADSRAGYTLPFSVYTGKHEAPGPDGLPYDVVNKLCTECLDQGYKIYMDNVYTSKNFSNTSSSTRLLHVGQLAKIVAAFRIS